MKRCVMLLLLILVSAAALSPAQSPAQQVPTPEQFYGFRMGADGEIARWDKIVQYFNLLSTRSDRVLVRNLGETTLGNPFLLAIFSSPDNLESLERYRQINKKLTDPRGLSDQEIESLVREGKYISAQSYSLHATEIGGTQAVSELAHELATSDNPTIKEILDKTIFLMFPSFNPDGQIMVTDWFYKYKNTPYDNTSLPYLYHFYNGHDNNRDSYQLTQKESRMFAQVVYREWQPQSYVDHHHMGSGGARFYIPPYLDPIHPNVDPLIWREHQLYGSHMAVALDQAGKTGIETGAPYYGWWQASFHMSTNYRNIAGMLTESANAAWADPLYILPDQLGGTRGRPEYKPQMSMPRLWPGGWWRSRDIVENILISSKAVLELGARYRESLLKNSVLKAKGNIHRGTNEPPYAYVIPANQHDFPTAVKLVRTFQMNGVEVHTLDKPYQAGSRLFTPGSFVISCAQPLRAFVKSFLEQINYPDNPWTRSHADQSPLRPYDLTAYSVSEHMGVEAIPMMEPLRDASMTLLKNEAVISAGTVAATGNAFILSHTSNESLRALNRILAKGYEVSWMQDGFTHEGAYFAPGTMLIRGGADLRAFLQALARDLGLDFKAAPAQPAGGSYKLGPVRLGLYKRYAGGNMDEGWTNWLLKDFEFNAASLFNKDMKDPGIAGGYDVIIIPDDTADRVIRGAEGRNIPEEYRGGIGTEGVENIKRFVREGGTLITLNGAWEFAQRVFELPVQNSLTDIPSKDFYCPGSTLRLKTDNRHPIAFGMPADALGLFRGSPSLRVRATSDLSQVAIPVRYPEQNILQSGWLIGEKHLSGKPAVVEFGIGKGKVILLAFPVQHRAQMHGTFKLLFNSICYGSAQAVKP